MKTFLCLSIVAFGCFGAYVELKHAKQCKEQGGFLSLNNNYHMLVCLKRELAVR